MYQYDYQTLLDKIIFPGLRDTLIMLGGTVVTCTLFGFILALILITTDAKGLRPNRAVYETFSAIINVLRSVPFIILIITIIPLTRFVVGTTIGTTAAIFSITIVGSPLLARLLEGCFKEVNPSLIEAARSFGASDWQITFNVIVSEAIPSIISNLTIGFISLLGFTAMAGTVGAGGLGAVALSYGYQNFNDTIMYTTVVILIVIVQFIQLGGNMLYRKLK
ncbi:MULTISPECIES: methionine ABC transporter permease [Paenibacillus]|uniref:Methionine ABC transporter permease n=1 Tax=Paenibacillus odorifer TaxID=189426 RepID=A0A1R0XD26_9BACL|nr:MULTISPECIES: methionine ABC transporter permease [Paenibacillus]AIQ73039.1 methionine ABC transporter permease [Paenibacillus odorifer]ETT69092.1 methionine ABC transporter permease [Paenibacillus sp. FSL H8-237]MEC0130052.1 ABC transporter permease [Paenibacillus odorifer]MEC0223097.1 ABC transporter permease [Paenibacillus odorifer]OMC94198.1 methionine ABC transporter permease [Paenibacillus odorifer]